MLKKVWPDEAMVLAREEGEIRPRVHGRASDVPWYFSSYHVDLGEARVFTGDEAFGVVGIAKDTDGMLLKVGVCS